jgi:hypothetical protein
MKHRLACASGVAKLHNVHNRQNAPFNRPLAELEPSHSDGCPKAISL